MHHTIKVPHIFKLAGIHSMFCHLPYLLPIHLHHSNFAQPDAFLTHTHTHNDHIDTHNIITHTHTLSTKNNMYSHLQSLPLLHAWHTRLSKSSSLQCSHNRGSQRHWKCFCTRLLRIYLNWPSIVQLFHSCSAFCASHILGTEADSNLFWFQPGVWHTLHWTSTHVWITTH